VSRVQLALNVSDIDAAVDFYAKLFGTEPAKRQPGYANFAIVDPPLKLVLIENPAARGRGASGHWAPLGRRSFDRGAGVDNLLLRRAGQGVDQ
jgi:catechol 2,3-dioxygenase-like lactoylglutathione lyase family enzyme